MQRRRAEQSCWTTIVQMALVLVLLLTLVSAITIAEKETLLNRGPEYSLSGSTESFPLDFATNQAGKMNRQRREAPDDGVDWAEPENATLKDISSDHQYYTMTAYQNASDMVEKYYVDAVKLLENKSVTGNASHPHLKNSYRRAVPVKFSFEFPFYGHKMSNLTIATGGFCYIGDHSHSWLAATQYIAPLMANFDTMLNDSRIVYADDGQRLIVEWKNAQLRNQAHNGSFNFELILYKNGDIVFIYKDVPVKVENISDLHHPCKVGISDAYLYQHAPPPIAARFAAGAGGAGAFSKRVIYEYHRIEVPIGRVVSNTVVVLTAQPTCISLETCEACTNATLKHFSCSWCHAKKANGGPFCTDESGLHRKRQQWIDGNCRDQAKHLYCDTSKDEEEVEESDSTPAPSASQPTADDHQHVVPLDRKSSDAVHDGASSSPSGASAALLLLAGFLIVTGAWIAYAYQNPHTASGQFLIKYRPSRWRSPISHVRYSATLNT